MIFSLVLALALALFVHHVSNTYAYATRFERRISHGMQRDLGLISFRSNYPWRIKHAMKLTRFDRNTTAKESALPRVNCELEFEGDQFERIIGIMPNKCFEYRLYIIALRYALDYMRLMIMMISWNAVISFDF